MFPENLVQACFQSTTTYYVAKTPELDNSGVNATAAALTTLAPSLTTAANASNLTLAASAEVFERRLKYIDGMNVLGGCAVV